ncbi:MAG: TetR/AcrR family transcriptional regulator [Micavibrio sp.]|nr:TetR/AcrR family transcriptional regulator [Micavibrio sp.]
MDNKSKPLFKCARRGRPVDETKRDAILDAASELFLKNGLDGTSMDDVARKADMAKLTVYARFPGKEALFKAVIERRCDKYHVHRDMGPLTPLPVREALQSFAESFMSLIMNPEALQLYRVIEIEAVRNPKIAQLFYETGPRPIKESFENMLSVWVKDGKVVMADVSKARDHFFSMLKGEAHHKALLGLAPSPEQAQINAHIESCINVFMAAYGPK